MQPEPSEVLPETPASPTPDNASPRQDGINSQRTYTPLRSADEEHGGSHSSGSEWSLSPSRQSPSETSESWLTSADVDNTDVSGFDIRGPIARRGSDVTLRPAQNNGREAGDKSHITEFPEEMLFQVLSHLTATDLLTVKLVSRRFCNLVNSPHAWMNAFSRYFPGPDSLRSTADVTRSDLIKSDLRSAKREFTRLTPNPSWTSEYLLRTKLLRCLAKGRPSLPFAAPSPGKPGKGYATFTFSSRLHSNATHMQAKFGSVLDKRLPQFIHGYSTNGRVTTSDKRGKFDGWGVIDQNAFLSFSFLYQGSAMWGLGPGEMVGVPNVMDLSPSYGMIYGEGTPGGNTFFLSTDEKRGRYVDSFLNIYRPYEGIPQVSPHLHSVCSVWIAKSASVPRLTRGCIGIMSGSSCGVLSAYSLGSFGDANPRFQRGELTARWLLSPGIPIIAIAVDEELSQDRVLQSRIWAVALNALGEVFVLKDLPNPTHAKTGPEGDLEQFLELRAWHTGSTAAWNIVKSSRRSEKTPADFLLDPPTYYPKSVWDAKLSHASQDDAHHFEEVQSWISKKPVEMRALFSAWDMRRRLEVDFGSDYSSGTGEGVFVFACGLEDDTVSGITRYVRCSTKEWRVSQFTFGRYKNIRITTTAIDSSTYANTTRSEDDAITGKKLAATVATESLQDENIALKLPGQRARLLGVGTGAGSIFVWNSRAQVPGGENFINNISPVRIIHTDSLEICSLALTSLYLVHGGSEGLVQAWDPLGSTTEPIRTISSRTTLNARRRAVIAAQTNPLAQNRALNSYAASSICLDPDPTVLRGVVAIGTHLRYWSYSSASAKDEMSKSQKRRLNKAGRSLNSIHSEKYMGTRRLGLKEYVYEEMANRELDVKVERAEAREQKRVANRFGLDLLGPGASEEEMLAYAKILSEEDQAKRAESGPTLNLKTDADEDQIAAVQAVLSEEDREKWKFASWEERSAIAAPVVNDVVNSVSDKQNAGEIDDVERAIKLSLEEVDSTHYSSLSSGSQDSTGDNDDDIAKAIQLSLNEGQVHAGAKTPTPAQTEPALAEDDMEEAVRRSLQESPSTSVDSMSSTPRSVSYSSSSSKLFHAEDDFPALHSSSPRSNSSPGTPKWGKGKGKRWA